MSEGLRPRRSVLYMPGANERALEKAKALPADALILDLEDAVAPDAKIEARGRVCAAAASGEYGSREITIRVNSIDTEWHADDLRAAAEAGPDGILVPKVNTVAEVHQIEKGLEAGGAPDHTMIWAMVETPIAMLHADEIASASDRLAVLVMGTNDLAKELHAEHVPGRHPLLTGLSLCLLAARASGKVILDGVYNDIKNDEGFAIECEQGRQMGFDGKTLIHPSQLEPCNRIFAPSDDEITQAREDHRGLRGGQNRGQGSGHGQRSDDREPPRRQRPPRPGRRRRHRRPLLVTPQVSAPPLPLPAEFWWRNQTIRRSGGSFHQDGAHRGGSDCRRRGGRACGVRAAGARAVALSCGSLPAAEDAVQEAFARAWERNRARRGVRPSGGLGGHGCAQPDSQSVSPNRDVRHRWLERAEVTVEHDPSLIDLGRAVDGLPRRQREVVVLHYYLGYEVRLIAGLLDVSEGNVKNALHRARASLARALNVEEEVADRD